MIDTLPIGADGLSGDLKEAYYSEKSKEFGL